MAGLPIRDFGWDKLGVYGIVDSDSHVLTGWRQPACQTLGAYRLNAVSGNISGLGAGNTLFIGQWLNPRALAIIQSVKVSAMVTGTITTAVPFDLVLYVLRGIGNVNTTAITGTSVLPQIAGTCFGQQLRSSMVTSAFTVLNLATTGGILVGSESVTFDTNPIGRLQGNSGTAVNTQFFTAGKGATTPGVSPIVQPLPIFARDNDDSCPIILAAGDGVAIDNPLVGPGSGTFSVQVQMEWLEVAVY